MSATLPAAVTDPRLDAALVAVDERLGALGEALRERDAAGIEQQANELHRTLTQWYPRFEMQALSAPASGK